MRFKSRKRNYEIDMCNGPLLKKMLIFTIPLILTGVLQLMFNAADIIVLGNFAGKEALAAVGSTGPLINLMVNIFMGLSVGTNVAVAKYYASENKKELSDCIHTSIAVSIISGAFISILGVLLARPMVELMGTPDDVLAGSTLYIRIYFCGMLFNMVYNFGSSILRAIGDTRRPLYFLSIAGIINVILNLIFVVFFRMGVAGVAIATVASQLVSCVLIIRCLLLSDSIWKMSIKKLKISKDKLFEVMKIGLPAGIQGSLFSISNVIIQSSINSFGSVVMAGNAAAGNLEGFVYIAMNAIYQTSITFTSQNMGARKYHRVNKILWLCISIVTIIGVVLGGSFYLFSHQLLSIYNSDPAVIAIGKERMLYVCLPYFICGIMDVMVGQLRGIGYSITPMIVSLLGVCASRIIWIYTIFAQHHTLFMLLITYPLSWTLTASIHLISYFILFKRKIKDRV